MYQLWNPLLFVRMKRCMTNDYFEMWSKMVHTTTLFDIEVLEDNNLFVDYGKTSATAFKSVFPNCRIWRCFCSFVANINTYGLFRSR